MRKLIIAAALSALLLTGCDTSYADTVYRETAGANVTMEHVVEGNHWDVYVHRQTGVMYAVYTGINSGGPVMLVNSDGSPMIWEGGE